MAGLAGRSIVVTRPRDQAAALCDAIVALGGHPLPFPLLAIAPASDPAPLNAAVARLAAYRYAVFISPNAVDHAVPAILRAGPWPAGLRAAAVGPGTARALAGLGIGDCLLPEGRFDSEGLLACDALAPAQVRGQHVAIFRGDGGRELLADTLRARGAEVDCITCYQRSGPPNGPEMLLAAWRRRQLDAITVSSSEGLRHLLGLLDAEGLACLQQTPLFVPHARIAETARALGLQRIILTPPADAGILEALGAYNWSA